MEEGVVRMEKKNKIDLEIIKILLLIATLIIFVFGYSYMEEWVYSVWPSEIGMVGSYSLPKLTWQFIRVAVVSCLAAGIIGVSIGVFCFTTAGKSFRVVIEKLAMIIQTVPTMAVLLFAVAALGIGMKAAVFALVFQSTLPIIFATVAGIDNIPKAYIEVGKGLGMTRRQILLKIKIPMALPIMLSGMRTALIICIGAATLSFSTGAGGLGLLIQTGCSTYNTVFILEGTVPICLLAILADKFLRKLENRFYRIGI